MSNKQSVAARVGVACIHSPKDDLESCFFVALWSTIFNKQQEQSLKPRELEMRDHLTECQSDEAAALLNRITLREGSDVMKRFRSMLRDWSGKVSAMSCAWVRVEDSAPADAGEKYYLPRFHLTALQGVVGILEVMLEHWDDGIGWRSWSSPSPPTVSH